MAGKRAKQEQIQSDTWDCLHHVFRWCQEAASLPVWDSPPLKEGLPYVAAAKRSVDSSGFNLKINKAL